MLKNLLSPFCRTNKNYSKFLKINISNDVINNYFLFSKSVCSFEEERVVYLNHLENDDKGIIELVMNRTAKKNAISKQFLAEFEESLDIVNNLDPNDARVLILKSTRGGNCFCAGADLTERKGMSPSEARAFVKKLRASFTQLEDLPIVTIAAIDGVALGGGLELSLACDLRFSGSSSKIGLTETSLAIIPGAGGTQRLPRIIGMAKAKQLIYTSKILTPQKAEEIGLINEFKDQEFGAEDLAIETARQIKKNGPIALRAAKTAINCGMQMDKTSGLTLEETCYQQVLHTQDRLEGLKAFAEKRKPEYKGN